jgi:hypothetical protein
MSRLAAGRKLRTSARTCGLALVVLAVGLQGFLLAPGASACPVSEFFRPGDTPSACSQAAYAGNSGAFTYFRPGDSVSLSPSSSGLVGSSQAEGATGAASTNGTCVLSPYFRPGDSVACGLSAGSGNSARTREQQNDSDIGTVGGELRATFGRGPSAAWSEQARLIATDLMAVLGRGDSLEK